MLILGYCPKCGYVFSGDEELDVNNFNDSRCRFCGFTDGLIRESEVHHLSPVKLMKFKRKLKTPEYFGRKPSTIEESQFYGIEVFGIDKNPLYSKEAAFKTAELRAVERKRKEKERDAKRKEEAMQKLMEQVHSSVSSKPRCPTCGSTNVSKIDAIDRAVSIGTLGIFSNKINKSFKCKDCGCTW